MYTIPIYSSNPELIDIGNHFLGPGAAEQLAWCSPEPGPLLTSVALEQQEGGRVPWGQQLTKTAAAADAGRDKYPVCSLPLSSPSVDSIAVCPAKTLRGYRYPSPRRPREGMFRWWGRACVIPLILSRAVRVVAFASRVRRAAGRPLRDPGALRPPPSAEQLNSIRHNLSLHSRFVRVQNEGTGKSSWWMINPDGGKGGKAPRRRAVSMDNSNKYTKSRGRAAKKKAALQTAQETSEDSPSQLSKWPGSPTSRSSDELDAWTDFRSRTNSNASTISGRLSPILASTELDDVQDDDAPLSPMLYSSPSSLSPSVNKPCTVELPRLTDMAGTMNLNDGLTDNLMDDLLDNITLPPSQQSPTGGIMQRSSSFPYGSKGSGLGSPSSSFNNAVFGPSSLNSLRQSPMQTIQENKQATFSSISHYNNQTLQDLLASDALSHSDVMMTQSDPLMSQASTAVSAQNSRRNIMLRNDPMMSFAAQSSQGGLVNQSLPHHQHQSHNSSLSGSRALSNSISNIGLSDSNSLGSTKHQQSPVNQSMQTLSDPLSGSSLYSSSVNLPVMGHEKFPSDLDLDIFNGSLECDMESIIRSELMDADGLDFNFDSLISAQNVVSLNVGNFTGAKQASSQSWVPG
ncbi:hypothetical protein QYF61_007508 [Mycteria americana]|uniref:Fork-head domain-containing protein n=1 Tax=Mycteria americana TaxID=33587 RepID=A0AAN7NDH3_MYCAM|nr:hypothetical protein QYF61_007508 [Mycteria americana]